MDAEIKRLTDIAKEKTSELNSIITRLSQLSVIAEIEVIAQNQVAANPINRIGIEFYKKL